ncbi:MAG TPA: glycine cleavage T C-terminal barrel domain-containing protein [Burkholderiales bacterium]|nr:glycine cleavage T C-terminal barrel domain-containing protein [Burkholderiales bacterium]
MSARLPPVPGEWIDRSVDIEFEFEGRPFRGFAGDTVTSALIAGGAGTIGRSFKYHRPRGVLSMANHDINAMMQDGARMNLRGDVVPLRKGMRLNAVNTLGGLEADRGRLLDGLSAFLPVGFYYKAFHSPKGLFPFWERMFRRMTGLGRLEFSSPRLRTPKRYDFCDVLVIGAGPSGLAAALAAADAGAKVCIVDENARVGGSLTYQRDAGNLIPGMLDVLIARIVAHARVSVRAATCAAGYFADHWVPLIEDRRMTKMRARAIVVATGVAEQPAVFRNNDLPGVMLVSAAQRLVHRYAVKPMESAVVLTANDEGYAAALDLHRGGIRVTAVLDLRRDISATEAAKQLGAAGVPIRCGYGIYEAREAKGRVGAAVAGPLLDSGDLDVARQETIGCEGILMGVGYAPAAALLYQSGAKMRFDGSVQQFVPDQLPAGVFAAGRVNGVYDIDDRLRDGARAGTAAAAFLGFASTAHPAVPRAQSSPSHPYPIFDHPKAKNFVDFDEDLQLKDFIHAAQEGFDNIELLKRYTTVGMGPSQGKHSNMNAIRILAKLLRKSPGEVGSTTSRPFFHPVPMSHLAGRGFHPYRQTPLHSRHEKAGAVFMQAGIWLRPEYYAFPNKSKQDAVREEASTVRSSVGMIDVGTLGKMEISGPDAAAFLERLYTGKFGNMKIGMTRYALMVDEAGVIIDDGVVARLGEDRFYFTTTTTGSANVYREMTRLNVLWQMQVGIVNATGAYAAINIAGPRSREVLGTITQLDLSANAFPYLGVREGCVADAAARVMRVGFVGELGYEIHVAADAACHLWDALMKSGQAHGIRPFGVEAQRLLRLEKAHIIIGQDTDGLTTPVEAAMGWAVKMDKPYFVGQRSLKIIGKKPAKSQLVGFMLEAGDADAAPKECHLVIRDGGIAGRVTSIAFSPALGRHVGLAFVAPDMAADGSRFFIRVDGGRMVQARVVPTPFYDPDGARQKAEAA